jgi:tetratricopeptide (TPR) repeat protein
MINFTRSFTKNNKKMKNLLIFLMLFLGVCANAQIQNGVVREMNSGKKPVPAVSVQFDKAVPTVSDDKGNFRLAFAEKKAGDLIFMQEIQKAGYELVNAKELEVLPLTAAGKLGADVILAKVGYVEAAKKQYYQISDAALLAEFEKEKKAMRDKLAKSEITQAEFLNQKEALQKLYEEQKATLDAMADRFARVNFDDVDTLYKEALLLFKEGKVKACQLKLENADLIGRATKTLDKKANYEREIQKIEEDLQKTLPSIQLLAQTYTLQFEIGKAETCYDQLLQIDSTNFEILQEAGKFYQTNHRYHKAIQVYTLVAKHPKAETWQVADAYRDLGNLYTNIGDLTQAELFFNKFHQQYIELVKAFPTSTLYKNNLATSYERLGYTHIDLGNLDKALFFFEAYNRLQKELYTAYPNNADFKNGLAISYTKLGDTHKGLGNLEKALEFSEEDNCLARELYTDYPNNVSFKEGLGSSNLFLGDMHIIWSNLDKALEFYDEAAKLFGLSE